MIHHSRILEIGRIALIFRSIWSISFIMSITLDNQGKLRIQWNQKKKRNIKAHVFHSWIIPSIVFLKVVIIVVYDVIDVS